MGAREAPGSDSPKKDPGPAPSVASGAAGSGLRPAHARRFTEASVPSPRAPCLRGGSFVFVRELV